MQVQAYTKYARMSPRKVREITKVIQGRNAADAVEVLRFIPRKSARLVNKTLQSAIANAENNNNLSSDALKIESATVEQGPTFKRFRLQHVVLLTLTKATSHIRIILTDEVRPQSESKHTDLIWDKKYIQPPPPAVTRDWDSRWYADKEQYPLYKEDRHTHLTKLRFASARIFRACLVASALKFLLLVPVWLSAVRVLN